MTKQICYKHPPITEAIIEVRFAEGIKEAQLKKLAKDFSKFYPQQQSVSNIGFEIALPQAHDLKSAKLHNSFEEKGFRCLADDSSQISVLFPTTLLFSQLAPYPGGDSFLERFERDWQIQKKLLGYTEIVRVGVRYINRIDIPISNDALKIEDFLNVYPELPSFFQSMSAFALQVKLPQPDIGCVLTLNTASIPFRKSPLPGHTSFVLDQDIVCADNVPQKDIDIINLLTKIRERKNQVFENCVTPKAKELFDHD